MLMWKDEDSCAVWNCVGAVPSAGATSGALPGTGMVGSLQAATPKALNVPNEDNEKEITATRTTYLQLQPTKTKLNNPPTKLQQTKWWSGPFKSKNIFYLNNSINT